MEAEVKIDLGCGAAKRAGYIGLDCVPYPGVDHVLDVATQPLPFGDASVSAIYSSHFFEHIGPPNYILSEIGRVCKDGASIEIITPYAFSGDAFVYGHVTFFTELQWLQFCVSHRDEHLDMLRGRWLLKSINFIVQENVEQEILRNGFSMDFAIKYFKSVVQEFCIDIEFRRDLSCPAVLPKRTYSLTRSSARNALETGGIVAI